MHVRCEHRSVRAQPQRGQTTVIALILRTQFQLTHRTSGRLIELPATHRNGSIRTLPEMPGCAQILPESVQTHKTAAVSQLSTTLAENRKSRNQCLENAILSCRRAEFHKLVEQPCRSRHAVVDRHGWVVLNRRPRYKNENRSFHDVEIAKRPGWDDLNGKRTARFGSATPLARSGLAKQSNRHSRLPRLQLPAENKARTKTPERCHIGPGSCIVFKILNNIVGRSQLLRRTKFFRTRP